MMLFSIKGEVEELRKEFESAFKRLLDTARFIEGEEVEGFEREFAEFCSAPYCVGCANGTDALIASLWALGIGCGDEVVLPALTFTATAEAVALVGARPVFADINADGDYNIDPNAVEAAITPRTAAVIAVHLYGVPADISALRRIARKHRLALVEDAAQAHGARYKGIPVGSLGDVACFSFYPTKNLGAFGDAGAVTTADAEIARRVRLFINHGRKTHTEHVAVGRNARMDAFQAAVLRVKLRRLQNWLTRRQHIRQLYEQFLANQNGVFVRRPATDVEPAWHLMIVECDDRDRVLSALKERGIPCGVHYPTPLHLMSAWSYLGYAKGAFPNAERATQRILSLPVHQYLSNADVKHISQTLLCCLQGRL